MHYFVEALVELADCLCRVWGHQPCDRKGKYFCVFSIIDSYSTLMSYDRIYRLCKSFIICNMTTLTL